MLKSACDDLKLVLAIILEKNPPEKEQDTMLKTILRKIEENRNAIMSELFQFECDPLDEISLCLKKKESAKYRIGLLKFCLRFYEILEFSVFFDVQSKITRLLSNL